MRGYSPIVQWDPQVEDYLSKSFGRERLQATSAALCRPVLRPTLRVNTVKTTPQEAAGRLQQALSLPSPPTQHSVLPYVLQLQGSGPYAIDYDTHCGSAAVIINRRAAEVVLKGADVFSPGLLAASAGLAPGQLVAVAAALEKPGRSWCGINRGTVLQPDNDPHLQAAKHLHIGTARCVMGRRQMFRVNTGLALQMVHRVWDIPPCNGVLRGEVMLQALPSIVAAAVLNCAPGSRVLDMCAAPGGKATMCAQLMGNTGQVIAIDRTYSKVERIRQLASDLGLTNIQAIRADATTIIGTHSTGVSAPVRDPLGSDIEEDEADTSSISSTHRTHSNDSEGSQGAADSVRFEPESFDYVMLDAPCSALGLRPRLLHAGWTLPNLMALASYQRALIHTAVRALKPGGSLVYCTCTINPAENEGNVRWLLDRWPGVMKLHDASPFVGKPGLVGEDPCTGDKWLSEEESRKVQRFDPSEPISDTIGFFIARFTKTQRQRQ